MSSIEQETLISTNFFFKDQVDFMRGKVRDVYSIGDNYIVLVASDRISAFDHVLPSPIPFKGQVLNQIASKFLDDTKHIVRNWKIGEPDPHVTVGLKCKPYPVEFVVRGYLAGHAWREYESGKRTICGEELPDGLKENDKLPTPILTPTTKAETGHDLDISKEEIVAQRLIKKKELVSLEKNALALFEHGSKHAESQNLILVDTKYEFGKHNDEIVLIDEIHTPDSSRYFYADSYEEIQAKGEKQRQLSKEFVRQWLIENNFQGLEGQQIPIMSDDFVKSVSDRYIELFEHITGDKFVKRDYGNISNDIETSVNQFISSI
ncbi:MAG: phosphoribosylaminoimidazolesuccinocarboxamide synthase [Bacteroidia bacterium]|nr:phosphoribosylaminoimidazolesuccinocarboxamide synthase [Bacteroidia bacterium]NNJ54599.1 phosphoribosylaminoimidazolesuccinocarboxamide synthase [Bacteroidia bacterium]